MIHMWWFCFETMLYEVLARASSKIASTVPCKRTCTGFSVRRLDVSRSFKWQSRFQDFWNAHRLNLHPLVVFDNDKVDQNTLFATILQLFSRFFLFHISSVISPSERHCHPSAVGEGLFSSAVFRILQDLSVSVVSVLFHNIATVRY